MERATVCATALLAAICLIGYVVLTALHDDGNALLGAAYAFGAVFGVTHAAQAVKSA